MRTISITAKCSDLFHARLSDGGKTYDGYVPDFLGGGDYVEMTIDLETGQIQNWRPPTEAQLTELFGSERDENRS